MITQHLVITRRTIFAKTFHILFLRFRFLFLQERHLQVSLKRTIILPTMPSHHEKPVLAKIISGLPDKISGRPSLLCLTFWSPVGHFSQLMTSKYNVLCQTFSVKFLLLNPAMSEPSARHQQKFTEHVRHISRELENIQFLAGTSFIFILNSQKINCPSPYGNFLGLFQGVGWQKWWQISCFKT